MNLQFPDSARVVNWLMQF